jgi:hypothetical protein
VESPDGSPLSAQVIRQHVILSAAKNLEPPRIKILRCAQE